MNFAVSWSIFCSLSAMSFHSEISYDKKVFEFFNCRDKSLLEPPRIPSPPRFLARMEARAAARRERVKRAEEERKQKMEEQRMREEMARREEEENRKRLQLEVRLKQSDKHLPKMIIGKNN